MNYLGLLAVAVAPGLALAVFVFLRDKHEKEPLWLMSLCFLLGIASAGVTLVISAGIGYFYQESDATVLDSLIHAFLVVALVEEFSKYLFVRTVAYPNKHFNEPYDGIVYAVMVSMGFATIENVLYVFVSEGSELETGIWRAFTAVPAHATFGVLMGFFLGIRKFKKWKLLGLVGLLSATVFHGAYDFFLFRTQYQPGMIFGALVSFIVSIVLSLVAMRIHRRNSPFASRL